MRKAITFGVALLLLACVLAPALAAGAAGQRRPPRRQLALCPDPTVRCRTSYEFKPHQLPFALPENAVLWETEQFYAVVLRSVRDTAQDCSAFIPEGERLAAQQLFPRHKVFASRCYDPEELYYTNIAEGQQFMAVYAGRTRAEAERMLAKVKATGKYKDANLRRMRTGFNGT
jgi:hypothetical protein